MNNGIRIVVLVGVCVVLAVSRASGIGPVNPDPSRALTRGGVDTINGAITFDETDLAIPAPSFDLTFERFYNSFAPSAYFVVPSSAPLGSGWRHSFDWSLTPVTSGAYQDRVGNFEVLRTGDGASYWFFQTNGVYLPPPDANLALAFTSGEYRVTWPGGTIAAFDTNGVIQAGRGQTVTYNFAAEHSERRSQAVSLRPFRVVR